jgi:hypothetical protein
MKFSIEVDMPERWVPQFLGMLAYMQCLGGVGSSRLLTFYSDGDGDFRPKFEWDKELTVEIDGILDANGNRSYDAG